MDFSVAVVIFILLTVAIIFILFRSRRKEKIDLREKRRQRLGFIPIELSSSQALINRILALQPNKTDNLRVTRISQKKILDGDLYLYDAFNPSIDNDEYQEDNLIVVSPLLCLPHFALFPLPTLDGKWGSMMNDLVGDIAGWAGNIAGLHRCHLTAFPNLDRKFTLLAENEEQIQVFFNAERAQSLASLDPILTVFAARDAIQVDAMYARGKNADEILDLKIATAIKLMQNLYN
jgi:hypothetical protein